jgi:hypothetical protein
MQQLDSNNGRAMFSTWSVQDVISKGQGQLIISSVQESVKRGVEPEADE